MLLIASLVLSVIMISLVIVFPNSFKGKSSALINPLGFINKENVERKNYSKTLQEIEQYRKTAYSYSKDSIRRFLIDKFEQDVFPAWYGTDWDFNGTSESPGEGSIACGYLVSTILKQSGFELNRYKLARQTASNIIKSTCKKSSIKYYKTIKNLNADLKENPGIYIIGLDYHVGFLISTKEKVWFFHSDYFRDRVIKESILTSVNLRSSNTLLVGNLLDNDALIDKWLKSETIKIFT